LSVYPALAYGIWRWVDVRDWRWLAAGSAHFLLVTTFFAQIYRGANCRGSKALLLPVSFPLLIGMLWQGLKRCRDRSFTWRGTAVTIPVSGE
jgi:hypothetical protein